MFLPPHATHLLQPLDVVCFQPLKHYHRQALDQSLRLGVYDFNRLDFIAAFNDMRAKAFKRSTILSAFAETGLIPYNPEKVLGPLRERQKRSKPPPSSTPSPTSSHTESLWPTPQNVPELREFAINLYTKRGYTEASPTFQRHLNRLVTVSLSYGIAGMEAEETLREHKKEAQKRAKRQAGTRRVICRGGALRVGDAADRIRFRRKEEVENAQRTSILSGYRGNARKSFKRKLDFMAALDDPNRSAPRADRAVSI